MPSAGDAFGLGTEERRQGSGRRFAFGVAGVIEPALQAAETVRSAARPTDDLTAYDLYLRAVAIFFPITKERIVKALGLFEQAIAIDPGYGPALSWAAMCHLRLITESWAEVRETGGEAGAGHPARLALCADDRHRLLPIPGEPA